MPGSLTVYVLTAAVLIGLGVYALLVAQALLRKLLALNLLGSGVFLLLVTLAGGAPSDPVPHALVLTGLVIAVSVTAFALALLDRLVADTGAAVLDEDPDAAGEDDGH